MHFHLLKIFKVILCSTFIYFVDLSGSSRVAVIDVSGCWSGKTSKSLSEERTALLVILKRQKEIGARFALPMQRSSVEISFLGCAHRDSRQNPQVSALFTEEDNYAR
jgi:hypothetical protein